MQAVHKGGETQQGKHTFGPLEVDLRSLKGLSIALEGQDFVDMNPPGHLMCVWDTLQFVVQFDKVVSGIIVA